MCESHNRVAVSPSPREAGTGWVLDAVFSNGKQAAISGFRTEAEANEWLGSARHAAWLREARSAFSTAAIFDCLGSYASVLRAAALEFFECRWRAGLSARFWRRAVCRILLAATATLLIAVAAIAIIVNLLVSLGRSEQPARLGPATTQIAANRPVAPSPPAETTEVSDPIALLLDRVSSSASVNDVPTDAAPETPASDEPADNTHAATPRPEPRRAVPLAIVGIWAPEAGSCSTKNAHEGALPAVISERGARAGKTSCIFKKQRQTEKDWRILAVCTNGHEHWTSNVRLTVKGDRLVWTSERGTQAYIRCKSSA
jgi:hypothetical protein